MYKLNAKIRESGTKSKKLRKAGLVPCSMNDCSGEKALLFTISDGEARKLIKNKYRGGVVNIHCNEESYTALISEIGEINMNNQIETITFQKIENNQEVSSVARIVTINKDKISSLVQVILPEIPYKALPENIVETIEIDLAKLSAGDNVKVADLAIADNPEINLMIAKDKTILHISSNSK